LLEKYTSGKTTKELKVDVERKRSEELAKKAAWAFETSKHEKLVKQIANCEIKAPADGLLVYANDPNRAFGSNLPQIEEGATVRERQKIFSLPDITRMQVNTKVHESRIDKLANRMKARIRVDAFANEVLNGTVLVISPLPDSTNFFSPRIKVYTTQVRIDEPLPGLRPGMTAQVEIMVSELDNVLSVPIEAIVRYDDKDHVAVQKSDGGIEWRELVLGQSNDRYVEVKQGIKSGESVVIKPLPLLSEEQKRMMKSSPTPPAVTPRGR
jgi:HlyD family secretion protein